MNIIEEAIEYRRGRMEKNQPCNVWRLTDGQADRVAEWVVQQERTGGLRHASPHFDQFTSAAIYKRAKDEGYADRRMLSRAIEGCTLVGMELVLDKPAYRTPIYAY